MQRQREVEMQKRILGCMQMTMRRGKQLREAEQKVRKGHQDRVMQTILATFNGLREVKSLRLQCLDSLFTKLQHKLLSTFFFKILSHAYKQTVTQFALNHRATHLKLAALKGLRQYLQRKQKED